MRTRSRYIARAIHAARPLGLFALGTVGLLAAALGGGTLAGCGTGGTKLAPAAGARPVPHERGAAMATAANVTVVVDGDDWDGFPNALNRVVAARVTVLNNGDEPVRLRHALFALKLPDGERVVGRSPGDLVGLVDHEDTWVPASPPLWDTESYLSPDRPFLTPGYGPGLTPGSRTLTDVVALPRPATGFSRNVPIPLPTADMIRLALAEGMLAPGARASGYVYFARPLAAGTRVELRAELVSARTGRRLGHVAIPFVARR